MLAPTLVVAACLLVSAALAPVSSAARSTAARARSAIVFSTSANRRRSRGLSGRRLKDNRTIYVFLPRSTIGSARSVSSVRWYIDDPNMSKPAWMVERNRGKSRHPQFDLQGSRSHGRLSNPFDVGALADTSHTITVAIVPKSGHTRVLSVSFKVTAAGSDYNHEVFDDEFNGSSVNQSNWSLYNGAGNAGFGRRSPSTVTEGGGQVNVTATNQGGEIVSGGLGTNAAFLYGHFEFRVKTSVDPTKITSGVVLMYPESHVYAQGEDDLYETLRTRTPLFAFLHALVPLSTPTVQDFFVQKLNAANWVNETVDWTPHAISLYRNGVEVWQDTNPHVIPTSPHTLNIQLDATTYGLLTVPVQMSVSYVRIYQ